MRNLFLEILARLGFWIPIDKHKPNPKYWDWVLVALREKSTGIFFIPKVAEFGRHNGRWHFDNDDTTEWRGNFIMNNAISYIGTNCQEIQNARNEQTPDGTNPARDSSYFEISLTLQKQLSYGKR